LLGFVFFFLFFCLLLGWGGGARTGRERREKEAVPSRGSRDKKTTKRESVCEWLTGSFIFVRGCMWSGGGRRREKQKEDSYAGEWGK
jgi:hypothetical protein